MADELGTAVLRITVDDSELRAQLRKAETLTRQTAQRLQTSASGGSFGQLDLAYKNALKTSEQLLQTDLKRLQVTRQFTQALKLAQTTRTASETSGFASFSQGIGGSAVDRSVRRNAEKRAQAEERRTAQLDTLDADLARVREKRNALERRAVQQATRPQVRSQAPGRPGGSSRLSGAISSGIIGGGFPLLFGQGVGAAIGGGVGGVGGGALGGGFGFALSIAGTALGSVFDRAIESSRQLSVALENPIRDFNQIKEVAVLSSRGLERNAETLIALGRNAEAAALIQDDISKTFGDTSQLKTLENSFDELNRTFAVLGVRVAQFAAGPLADFLDRIQFGLTASPERQLEFSRAADQAVGAVAGPLGVLGAGFTFGPLEVEFDGQKFTGSATGIRQAIIQYLIKKDLEEGREARQVPDLGRAERLQAQDQLARQRQLSAVAPGARDALGRRLDIEKLVTEQRQQLARAESDDVTQGEFPAIIEAAKQLTAQAETAGLVFTDYVQQATEQLRRTADDLSSRLRLAQLDLVNIQGDPRTDVNRFLSRETRVDQLRQSLTSLAGPLQEAISTAIRSRAERGIQTTPEDFSRLTGIVERAREGGGVGARGLEIVSGFIRAVEAEGAARRTVETTQQDLVRTNNEIVSINTQLVDANRLVTEAVQALAAKNWNVEVNVDASGSVSTGGDINRALP